MFYAIDYITANVINIYDGFDMGIFYNKIFNPKEKNLRNMKEVL